MAEDKKSQRTDSKPLVPRDKDDAVTMLCTAAQRGDLVEISELAKWEHTLPDQPRDTPPVINGKMWERSYFEEDNASTDLTDVNITYWTFQTLIIQYPLLAALEAPNAETFLHLISFKPQSFINKYPFSLIRTIIWWPLWPREEKLKALEAVWDVLLSEQRDMLKEKNGALLRKENLPDLLKNLTAKSAASTSEREEVSGDTSLTQAAENGQLETVKRLLGLDQGASIEETDDEGDTALLIASKRRDLAMIRLLCEKGASVTAKNNQGDTALVLAARHNNNGGSSALRRVAVNYLITEAGANPGDGFDIAGYLSGCSTSLTAYCAERPNAFSPEQLASYWKRAAQLKALYDTYQAKQQARIDEALGEESSPLVGVEGLRLIIGGYAAPHPDGDLEPIPKTPHSESGWKDTQPTMVNLSQEQQNGEKEFKSIDDAAKFFNKSGFQGTSGWSVTGAEEISVPFDDKSTRKEAKKKLKDDHSHAIFRETETTPTPTSPTLDTSYHLHAKVRVSQASDVMQSHSSANTNGVPNLYANTAGSFTHPRSLPTDPSANNTVPSSSSTSTNSATQEQQPTEQDGSDLNL